VWKGKQYVVIAAGGHASEHQARRPADRFCGAGLTHPKSGVRRNLDMMAEQACRPDPTWEPGMTISMDDRRRGFESKWAHDLELRFQIEARRNRALGEWAAAR